MDILINTIPLLAPLTGVGNYTYQISRKLRELDAQDNYWYFYGWYSRNLKNYSYAKALYNITTKIPFMKGPARKIKDALVYLGSMKFDLYFEPNFIPINIKAKRIATTVHDFSWKLFPQWHPQERVGYFEKNFWKKIEISDRIIVVSRFIRDEAINTFGLPADKIRVIYNGFDGSFFRKYKQHELEAVKAKYNLPKKFILFAGSIEPRKNLKNLILAYSNISKNIGQYYKLVLVGYRGWENNEIMKLLERSRDNVIFLGFVSNTELGQLYNLATLFAYPSFYEGFGLPPLEAMACGCPVLASNVASLPEVCRDAAYYVDPNEVDSIADGICRVINDEELRKTLTRKGLSNVQRFNWTKSAKEHLRVFREVTGG